MASVSKYRINRQLRFIGGALRKLKPYYTEETLQKMAHACNRVLSGKWIGRNSKAETSWINRPDGSRLRVLVVRSKNGTSANATGLLWIHGGGYAIGAPEQDVFFVDRMVADGTCVAVMPAYTLSTQEPYPAALDDCYRALLWMRDRDFKLGINRNQLFVGGDSAGGGLAAALCLYARDLKTVNIAFQMPLYPMLDDRQQTQSSRDNDAPVWNSKSNEAAWALYLRSIRDREVPVYAAPARALDLSGLPPMCTYVGTIEPFYDETKDYVMRIRQQGGTVFFREFEGCFHAFDLMGVGTAVAKEARNYLMTHFRYAQTHYYAKNPGP